MKIGYLNYHPQLLVPSAESYSISNIAIELVFDQCDLNCPFCPNINLPRENVKTRLDNCLRNFQQLLPKLTSNRLSINITGTELFQDRYDDAIFFQITSAIDQILSILKQSNKQYYIQVTTHLIVNKIDRLMAFMSKYRDITINTSYDFEGRFFDSEQTSTFIKNAYMLKSRGVRVTIDTVAHKKNIEKIMMGTDPLVNQWIKLYHDFECNFVLWQNTGASQYQVDNKMLSDFVIFLINYYPNTQLAKKFICALNGQRIDFDCRSCIGIDNDIIKFRRCLISDRNINKQRTINTLNCCQCQYFNVCGSKCWCEFQKQSTCWIKEVLDNVNKYYYSN